MGRLEGFQESNSEHIDKLRSRAKPRVVDPLRTNTRAPALPRLQRGNNLRAGDNSNEGGSPSPEQTSSKPSQVDPDRVANTPRPQPLSDAPRANATPSPPPNLLQERTAGLSPEGSVIVAPDAPENKAHDYTETSDDRDSNSDASPTPYQLLYGDVANRRRHLFDFNTVRAPPRGPRLPSPSPSPPSNLLRKHTADFSPEGTVVVAPQVPENLADLALVTAHHGSTLAGGRLSTRIIEFCIRMVWESCSGGIALSSAALKFIKAALLCVRPVVRTTVRMLMDFLRGLLPETIAILGPHLTNETTPAGHAQAPISGAHTVLGEVPETAPEATSPSSTNETSALVLHQTPTVQSEPEASEERHSASGKDHSEVVSAPAKLKTAELQSDIEASKPLHSATGKYHISTVTKPTVVGSQSSPNFQKRLHSPITTPTLFWTGRRTLASPRSRLQFPGLIARPSGFDNFLGANDVSSREELAEPSTIIMKYDSGHDDRQLAPLGDFWATNLPVLLDRDGRELPVHNLRQLDLESSAKCHALVQDLVQPTVRPAPWFFAKGIRFTSQSESRLSNGL